MAVASKALDFLENMDDRDSKTQKSKVSVRDVAENKLFGKKRNKVQVGKLFKKKGKGVGGKAPVKAKMDKLGKGVSPSMAEFDKMVSSAAKSSKGSKNLFNRKSD